MRNAMNMKVQIRKQKTLPQKTHRKIIRKSLPRIQLIDIHYGYTIYSEENMIATVSRWGNSLGIRIPADIANSSGINDGDKVDITRRPDGSIVIQKKKKDKKKSGKPNIFVRIGRFFKEMFSELKKVSWPDAKKVFTQLGVVLLVVVIFLIIITAFDFGAAKLLTLLVTRG